jgi:hypothetical protein
MFVHLCCDHIVPVVIVVHSVLRHVCEHLSRLRASNATSLTAVTLFALARVMAPCHARAAAAVRFDVCCSMCLLSL